jgi:hypothetical protein
MWLPVELAAMGACDAGREVLWKDFIENARLKGVPRAMAVLGLPSRLPAGECGKLKQLAESESTPPVARSAALSKLSHADPLLAGNCAQGLVEKGIPVRRDHEMSEFARVALQVTVGCVREPSEAVRAMARTLASAQDTPPAIAAEALRLLREDPSPETTAALSILVTVPKADVTLRLRAARFLGKRPSRAAAQALIPLLTSETPALRIQAALSIQALAGQSRFADLLTTEPKAWKAFQAEWEAWLKTARFP